MENEAFFTNFQHSKVSKSEKIHTVAKIIQRILGTSESQNGDGVGQNCILDFFEVEVHAFHFDEEIQMYSIQIIVDDFSFV